MKHTSGPWKICEHSWSDTSVRSQDGITICSLSIYDRATEKTQRELESEMDANARLIGNSPDLLEALEFVMQDLEMELADRGKQDGKWSSLVNAREVIDRVKGTNP